jgi:hypothetical protein
LTGVTNTRTEREQAAESVAEQAAAPVPEQAAGSVAEQAASRDPAVGLRAVAALRRLAEQLEALQVRNARAQGWSWEAIGAVLGVSKQAVHKKHRTSGR